MFRAIRKKKNEISIDFKTGKVFDAECNYLGHANEQGVVKNNETYVGCTNPDGTVLNEQGDIIGRVAEYKAIISTNGNIVGRLSPNGQVISSLSKRPYLFIIICFSLSDKICKYFFKSEILFSLCRSSAKSGVAVFKISRIVISFPSLSNPIESLILISLFLFLLFLKYINISFSIHLAA